MNDLPEILLKKNKNSILCPSKHTIVKTTQHHSNTMKHLVDTSYETETLDHWLILSMIHCLVTTRPNLSGTPLPNTITSANFLSATMSPP